MIYGLGFSAIDITISSIAGAAVENWGHHSDFSRVKLESGATSLQMRGYQQFYRRCLFYGRNHVIAGHAITFFQRCEFYAKKASPSEKILMIGDLDTHIASHIVFIFHLCTFGVAGMAAHSTPSVFLGTLSEDYGTFIVLQSHMDPEIAGYVDDESPAVTSYFAIFENTGLHSGGVKSIDRLPDYQHASGYSLRDFLEKDGWTLDVENELDLH